MSNLFATAGSKLYIGSAPMNSGDSLVVSAFDAVVWTEVKGMTNLGGDGGGAELITSGQIDSAYIRKLKGLRNAGAMQVVADLDYADAGQLALIAAEKTRDTYPFKIRFNDAPAGGTPSERYFVALVMSASEQWNEANSVMALNSTLEIDSNIVRVAASVGGSAPDNTALPAITGTATVGQTLTGSNGTWTGDPTPSLSRQWFADGESLPGKTASTLLLAAEHEGAVITFMVTASNYHGTAHALSAPTSAVAGG